MFGDRNPHQISVGPFTSDADMTSVVCRAKGDIIITDAYLFNSASVATHASNYITYKLVNLGSDAQGTTVVATASTSQTGGSAIAAYVPFPLTITDANKTISNGQVIAFVRDEQNTDAAAQSGMVCVVSYIQVGATS